MDIHTIGAGGGSIAHVDAGGVLHVGPESAGADPGPACYGRGGTHPTTTDAQLVLARLDAELWRDLYGWELDGSAAEDAVRQEVAEPLGLPVVEAAEAILDVTVNNLVEAIRLVSVQRGYDPRSFALAAYGGAGPMYGVDLARALEIPEVIVPLAPGVTSALGLLQVDLAVRTQRSVLMPERAIDEARLGQLFDEMEHETRQKLLDSGYSEIGAKRQIDVRYFGQSRYMTIDAPSGAWTSNSTAAVIERFNAEHEREYGYVMPSHINQVELANLRVVTETPVKKAQIRRPEHVSGTIAKRKIYFNTTGFIDTPILHREQVPVDGPLKGPAIVEQVDTTTVLPPGSTAHVDESGNLVITV